MFEKVTCKDRKELYTFLKSYDTSNKKETNLSSIYYLVEHDGIIEPLHFMHYEDSFFESDCTLIKHEGITEDNLSKYVEDLYEEESYEEALEYEKTMLKDGEHYEIENFQCMPFLKENITILDVFSESECLNYLLKN